MGMQFINLPPAVKPAESAAGLNTPEDLIGLDVVLAIMRVTRADKFSSGAAALKDDQRRKARLQDGQRLLQVQVNALDRPSGAWRDAA